MLIYKITNIINGKIYVGKTTFSLEIRKKQHIKSINREKYKNIPLYKAFKKYGIDNFSFEIIDDNIKTIEELNEKEIFYISKYNSMNDYNMTPGGDGRLRGSKVSEEQKNKNSFSQRLEGYIKIYGETIGVKKYNEKINKMRESQNKRYSSEEERKKCACIGDKNGMFSKKHSPETIAKISASLTGKTASESTKLLLSSKRAGEKNPMYKNGYKISGDKNGRAKQWILKTPDNQEIKLNGNVYDFCSKNNLSCEILLRFKNKIVDVKLRKCKNEDEFEKRKNTLGYGLFEIEDDYEIL